MDKDWTTRADLRAAKMINEHIGEGLATSDKALACLISEARVETLKELMINNIQESHAEGNLPRDPAPEEEKEEKIPFFNTKEESYWEKIEKLHAGEIFIIHDAGAEFPLNVEIAFGGVQGCFCTRDQAIMFARALRQERERNES